MAKKEEPKKLTRKGGVKSKYYHGIPRRKFEDEEGREILDPTPMRNSVQDAQSLKDLKETLFMNNRVMDDSEYQEDEFTPDNDGEEFEQPGAGRYEQYAAQYDQQSEVVRESRKKELESANKAKREKYEAQQRAAAKKKYGFLDQEDIPNREPSDSET